ncbi:MAG: hypothetical protein ACUVYA_09120 [Planctomycetota bacterium]
MGMRLKLREYKAHPVDDPEERRERVRQWKAAVALVLGFVAPLVVLLSIFAHGESTRVRPSDRLRLERVALAQAGSPYVGRSKSPEFLYHNWGQLPEAGPAARAGDATREAPEPEDHEEVYRDLRGLAVYEIREGQGGPEETSARVHGLPPDTEGALRAAQEAQAERAVRPAGEGGSR